uniref:(California timema) hypothetical protein n=1 Tax=Timema californicum TaxID=61474 RepID=A0A7R9JGB7_TIMCA|nr:unnamed protein product [Timema californicum]
MAAVSTRTLGSTWGPYTCYPPLGVALFPLTFQATATRSRSLMGIRWPSFRILVEHLSLADIPLVIVSPSMSGEYSVPFVSSHWQIMAGYIPVAPVASGSVTQGVLSKIGIPTLILHGDNDKTGLAESSLENLKVIPMSKEVEFKGAGHACLFGSAQLVPSDALQFPDASESTQLIVSGFVLICR